MIRQFPSIWQPPSRLPPPRSVEHVIDLVPGFSQPLYKLSPLENDEIKRQLQELLDLAYIRPYSSPCASPVMLVPRFDGSYRLYIDCMELNKTIVKNRYPLSTIDDLFDQLQGAKYFTKLYSLFQALGGILFWAKR